MSAFDGIHREPKDTQAAKLLKGGGVKLHEKPIVNRQHWDICPPLKPKFHTDERLEGRRFGRMIVMGLIHPDYIPCNGNYGRWVCRCDCGMFEIRKAASIKRASNQNDRCEKCWRLDRNRREFEFRTTGRWPKT